MFLLVAAIGGCLPGASGGGAYLVPVVDVPTGCEWWRCLPGASVPGSLRAGGCIYGRHRGRSGRRRISAAVCSLV